MWLSSGHLGCGRAHCLPFHTRPVSQQPPSGVTWLTGHCGAGSSLSSSHSPAGSFAEAEAVYCTPSSLCSTSAEIAAFTVLTRSHSPRTATSSGMCMVIVIVVYLPTGMSL